MIQDDLCFCLLVVLIVCNKTKLTYSHILKLKLVAVLMNGVMSNCARFEAYFKDFRFEKKTIL